jgi:hypothetical protein
MNDRKSNSPNGIKIQLSTKLVIMLIVTLGLGIAGGGYGRGWINNSGDDKKGHKGDHKVKSDGYNVRFQKIEKDVSTNTKDIKKIKQDVDNIKDVQIEDVASREARRVLKEAKGPKKWDDYDRLLRLNRERLKRAAPACSNKACSN